MSNEKIIKDRMVLHDTLVSVLKSNNYQDADNRVYYQPPESVKLRYPAIIYSRDVIQTRNANDAPSYTVDTKYQLTYITKEPDDAIVYQILEQVPFCRHVRHYVADNLHHDVFSIYN